MQKENYQRPFWISLLAIILFSGSIWGGTLSLNRAQLKVQRTDPLAPVPYKIAFADKGLWIMNQDGGGKVQLTAEDPKYYAFSPDGSMIAFSIPTGGAYNLWVMNIDGTHKVRLVDAAASYGFYWSPDGNEILFASDFSSRAATAPLREKQKNWTLSVKNADGSGEARVLVGRGYVGPARWSPDGSTILFENNTGIFKIDVEAGEGAQPRYFCRANLAQHISWSPDGTKILISDLNFTNGSNGSAGTVILVNADGSNPHSLQTSTARFSPDSSKIAYVSAPSQISTPGSMPTIMLMNEDESDPESLVEGGLIDWSPDGKRLMYTDPKESDLLVIEADGGNKKRLFDGEIEQSSYANPRWAPDGRGILFIKKLTNNSKQTNILSSISVDGSKEASLLDSGESFTSFAVQP